MGYDGRVYTIQIAFISSPYSRKSITFMKIFYSASVIDIYSENKLSKLLNTKWSGYPMADM